MTERNGRRKSKEAAQLAPRPPYGEVFESQPGQ